jgi:hemolysin activation/secretion protein
MMKKALLIPLLIIGLHCTLSQAAESAAAEPGSIPRRPVENRDYYRLERELQEEQSQEKSNVTDNNAAKQETMAADSTAKILIRKIVTDPSEILSGDEIGQITAKYEELNVGIAELYQMLQAINELYLKKGYFTAKAVLPPQKIEDGVVRIQLVEAHYDRFLLEGNEHTRSAYILKRLLSQSGNLVNIATLERDIFYFNRTNDVQIRAELKPGQGFGLSDCLLTVEEPQNIQTTLFGDNAGSVNTGQYRYGLTWTDNSLFGNRDCLMVNPLWVEGTWAGSLSYSSPVNKFGTRLGFTYSRNQSNVISGPYASLDIVSNETDLGINLSHPFRVKPNFKWDGFISLYQKDAETDFSGMTLIDYQVKTYAAGVAFQNVDSKGFWYSRYDLSQGESDIGDDFLQLNVSVIRQQKLQNDQVLIGRLVGQATDGRLLPSTEQFSIGGMSTVRGFSNGQLSGDQGYNLSIEYDYPIRALPKLKGILFIDHGGAFPFKGNNNSVSSADYLTSVGFGANFVYSKRFSGKVVVGVPLNPPEGQESMRIDFLLNSVLF